MLLVTPESRRRKSAAQKLKYNSDPDFRAKTLALNRAWKAANRERHLEWNRAWSKRYQPRRRDLAFQKKFGLTLDQITNMAISQGFQCSICNIECTGFGRGRLLLAVDHDHETGKFRGLLCGHCNTGLGLFHDSTDILQSSLDYIESALAQQTI